VPVRLTILGSGSSGNCAYVETEGARILIDAGFSLRQIRQRLSSIGRAPENLTGILITHEHADHVAGVGALGEKLGIPVYCNRPTKEAIEYQLDVRLDCHLFNTGASFELGDVQVETFTIPHDAQEPVGYMLRTAAGNIGIVTDLGHTTRLVLERIRHANALVLESNHDIKMLQDCPRRPWSLKQRILGRHGHLSNEAAASAIEQIMSDDLRHLYLGHLSRECNRPELALKIMSDCLQKIGASHVQLQLTSQSVPCPTLELASLEEPSRKTDETRILSPTLSSKGGAGEDAGTRRGHGHGLRRQAAGAVKATTAPPPSPSPLKLSDGPPYELWQPSQVKPNVPG
jgi:phosphoribosyl 1,2-cyclic phosphodiesterase